MMRWFSLTRRLAVVAGFVGIAFTPVRAAFPADAEISSVGASQASEYCSYPGKADLLTRPPAPQVICVHQPPYNLVKAAQRLLAQNDYQPGPVDGIIGPKTTAAVMAWQREHDLEPLGVLDPATLASMGLVAQ